MSTPSDTTPGTSQSDAVTDEATALEALERLKGILRDAGSVCIGYSGGVDSAFLAVVAVETLGPANVLAVTGHSASVPQVQREHAERFADQFGIPHIEIETGEVSDPQYAANPPDRCYFCKTELWARVATVARRRGLAVVVDGSNADDLYDHRPGSRAAIERNVRSPLQEARLTKEWIRWLSKRMGLPTWNMPASPCLASRLPYGIAVTSSRLGQVEDAEAHLRRMGFREFRVRHHDDSARVELVAAELPRAYAMAEQIDAALRALGFERVLLDIEGYRRGALNEPLPIA